MIQAEGILKIHGYGILSNYEKELFKAAIPELKKNIEKGIEYVNKSNTSL